MDKKIILGITGGIAAYKSAEIIRHLRQADFQVRVVMSAAATQFITPLTLQVLSEHPVHHTLLDPAVEAQMPHIELARWADLVLVAPASAHCIARLAHGLADDLLTTLYLATEAPLWVAPAMNSKMWLHPATQKNLDILRQRGVTILGPAEGQQACGEVGPGRMMAPEALLREVSRLRKPARLRGVRVLLTAGPTREAIDPVRFISNRSSGRMGFAMAAAAYELGAEVCLVSGPVVLPTPAGALRIEVENAKEMCNAVLEQAAKSDIFIAVAAVSDYRPANVKLNKIKKAVLDPSLHLNLLLETCPDILSLVGHSTNPPFLVGFAAETENLDKYAKAKLVAKKLDMIAANLVGTPGSGFESEQNSLAVFWSGGGCRLGPESKIGLARTLMIQVANRYYKSSHGKKHSGAVTK